MSPYIAMFIPAVVAICGGILALFWNPTHQWRSQIQHFAAGVVLAALAVEVLPELGREHASPYILIGSFILGGAMMYMLKLWSMRLEEKEYESSDTLNYGLIAATFIDVAVDGFIIGAGFAAGAETGLILALGLSVELLFLGLSLVSNVIRGWKVVLMTSLLSATVLGGTFLGNALLSGAPANQISAILSFGTAALLYLVTDELLIEAHSIEEKTSSTLWLFSGFLIFWSIQLFNAG